MSGYTANYPEQKLEAVLDRLPEKDLAFARDLIAAAKRGSPSPKQLEWIDRLALRAVGEAPASSRETFAVGDMSGAIALFDKAAVNARKPPAVVLRLDGQKVRLSRASQFAVAPDTINVKVGEVWQGRILRDGKFEKSPRADFPVGLLALLEKFAKEPIVAAQEYARETGCCCFCAKELTDERSKAVSYGPVCARKYGLPWGDK